MFSYLHSSWTHRTLIRRLTRREFEARFRGSFLGLFWAVIVPLVMLGVFSLVFGGIFGSRWPQSAETAEYGFPLILFSGLIVFGILSEPVNRAPGLILENISYVKKVVFPLEILPVVALISSLVTAAISFSVFLAVFIALHGFPPVTMLALPVVLAPLILITLGLVYVLASLGVFLRDLKHATPPLTTAMLFLSPVFYPVEILPEEYRWWLYLNPITTGVIHAREIIFWGRLPDAGEWIAYLLVSLLVATAGAYWFTRTEKAFADVV